MRTTIEMAREAAGDDWGLFQEYMSEIHKLVELVRADERVRMAEQPAQQCKWPTCQSEEYQQALAEQIKRELVGEQPAQQQEPVADNHQAFIDSLPSEMEDKMFEQIHYWARQSYARHQRSTRGQTITAADSSDNHIIWAALRWAKENAATPPAQPAQQFTEDAPADCKRLAEHGAPICGRCHMGPCKYTTSKAQPAQRKPLTDWIDPNDKTQKQYLPHIGEPVLFCNNGMTYMGKHTGGSFQSEVTNQYFNTWECQWMYLPAAHGIKENT